MAKSDATIKVKAEDLTGKGLESAKSRSQKAFDSIKKAAVVGGAAVAGALGLGAVSAIKQAAAFEQSQIAFETMLGSADKAKTLLSDITKFAAATPFELPEIEASAKSMLAFGFSAEEIIPKLRGVGDIAAGVGVPIQDLAVIYGKARTAGTLYAEDVNQLTERGIPIIKELAKQFGVAESEIKGLVSEGKVGFPNLEQAFADLSGEGGTFFNLMEKQSQSFSGQMSNLKDGIGQLMRGIGMELLPVAKRMVGFVNGSVLPAFSNFYDMLKSSVLPIVGGFISHVKEAVQTGRGWTDGLDSLTPYFSSGIILPVEKATEVIMYLIKHIREALKTGEAWTDGLDGLTAHFNSGFILALESATKNLLSIREEAQEASRFFTEELIPVVMDVAKSVWEGLQPTLERAAEFITDTLLPTLSGLAAWFSDEALPKIKKLTEEVGRFITDAVVPLIQWVSVNLMDVLEKIIPIIVDVAKKGFEVLLDTISNVVEGINNLIGWMQENEAAVDSLRGVILVLIGTYAALKTAMLIQGAMTAVTTGLLAVKAAAGMLGAAGSVATLTGALALLPLAVTIGVALAGFDKIMSQINDIKGNLDAIDNAQQQTRSNTDELIRRMHEARRLGDDERADRLRRQIGGINESQAQVSESSGGIFGIFGRATGGNVNRGQPYEVGERGREVFVPRESGTIVPSSQVSTGPTVNINGPVSLGSMMNVQQLASEIAFRAYLNPRLQVS